MFRSTNNIFKSDSTLSAFLKAFAGLMQCFVQGSFDLQNFSPWFKQSICSSMLLFGVERSNISNLSLKFGTSLVCFYFASLYLSIQLFESLQMSIR